MGNRNNSEGQAMIVETQNPFYDSDGNPISDYDHLPIVKKKVDDEWDLYIEGFEKRIRERSKRFRDRYAETLCECGKEKYE